MGVDEVLAPSLARNKVPPEETWDLSPIFADLDSWQRAASELSTQIETAMSVRDTLGRSVETLLNGLEAVMTVRETVERLVVYAVLWRDQDSTNMQASQLHRRAVSLAAHAGAAIGFTRADLLAIPSNELNQYLEHPQVASYRHLLHDIRRYGPHTRSSEVESLLAQYVQVGRAPRDAFYALVLRHG